VDRVTICTKGWRYNMEANFREWACSFSGCDGGNVDANIWLCGIEWGRGSYGDYYSKDLPMEISNGKATILSDKYDWKDSITYPYGVSFAKLYMSIQGKKVEDYEEVTKYTGSELFKLNLYPIAFDSTDHNHWDKHGLNKITGFENKFLFNTWCFFNRFPVFADLRRKHKPSLIICTGVDYLRDFLMFFGGNERIEKVSSGKIHPASERNIYDRTYYWVYLDEKTLLVVIPFFSGRYGLNSNHLLQEMGEKIRGLLKENNK